jgi:hypothetical protein
MCQQYEDEIAEGVARAFFVSHWASNVERRVRVPEGEPKIHLIGEAGVDHWENVAPKRMPNLTVYQKSVWRFLGHLECVNDLSLEFILRLAAKADGHPFRPPQGYGYEFGRAIGYEAMGRGINWFDNHAYFALIVPYFDANILVGD